jgi:hypothetical protein
MTFEELHPLEDEEAEKGWDRFMSWLENASEEEVEAQLALEHDECDLCGVGGGDNEINHDFWICDACLGVR